MSRKGYCLGGGIGSLSAAFFMINEGKMNPSDVTIYEALDINGGSCDGSGNNVDGYIVRGGRMFNLPTYECLQAMMSQIPSLYNEGKTMEDDFVEFNKSFETHCNSRLVDHNRMKYKVDGMGFTMKQRIDLLKLYMTSEEKLGNSRITEHFDKDFFTTNFWYMWSTTFAFQPWHSAIEFKRYLIRFTHEYVRIQTLEGVARSFYNQYDSIILPIETYLKEKGVNFVGGAVATDIDVKVNGDEKICTGFTIKQNGKEFKVNVSENDLVIVQNGSMCDASSIGNNKEPAKLLTREDGTSWQLWKKLSSISNDFGNPEPFFRCIPESIWQSFTVTINNDTRFFDQEIEWSENIPGTGALVTFKDSNWLMSIVVAAQPHFKNQPDTCQVFWGYGLFPDRVGNFVNKPMIECTGDEILTELCGHLRFDRSILSNAICKPCIMPYITAQFMTRLPTDRPLPHPKGSKNIGFTSQFVEIPGDVVFTVEYSVRAAQMAVYGLLGLNEKNIPKINHYERNPIYMVKAVKKSFQDSCWSKAFKFCVGTAAVVGAVYGGKKVINKIVEKL